MAKGASARRHAQAILQLALERNQVDQWRKELEKLSAVLSDPQLQTLLADPRVPFAQKAEVLQQGLEGVSPFALNLAYLLASRGRLSLIDDIRFEYNCLADAQQGLGHAEVATAIPLDHSAQQRLAERLSALTGLKVVVTTRVDPALVGGFQARIGDRLIDGSTRSRLESLRRNLAEAARQ